MSLSRIVLVFLAAGPFACAANKEMMELQRDVAMLQDQVRNMQKDFGDRLVTMQTLVQTTLDAVTRTNNLVNVMENKFNEAMKQQQQGVTGPILAVGQKLDQNSEDFRAVREAVLDMNTRMGRLDAKMADLQNLINAIRTPPPPPPGADTTTPQAQTGPPPGLSAETLYSNAVRDIQTGKKDLALQELLDYLKYFPSTQFAATAQYYVGDIYYNQPDYEKALEAFDAVLEKYPDGNKTPDAHYMKAVTLLKLGRNNAAADEFAEVIRLYGGTDLAAKAQARRREMGLPVRNTSSSKRKGR